MAGKTKINGTEYTIKGGKCKVNSTVYSIKQGKTKIEGTSKTIAFSRLPSGFQEVEYIQSDGSAYITYAVSQSIPSTYEFYCDWDTPAYRENTSIFATVNKQARVDNVWNDSGYANQKFRLIVGDASKAETTWSTYGTHPGNFIIKRIGDICYVNDTQVYSNSWTAIGTTSFQFFRMESSYITHGALREFWFTSSVYSCHLIPCYRTSDSVIGLYDIINDVFYTNSGGGSFSKGADV